jgi:glycosyltransferase involved in cell wall biosynthesis
MTLRVFVQHVHRGWMNAFVRGPHEYLVPGERAPEWPRSVTTAPLEEVARAHVDVVVLQHPDELDGLAESRLGGRVPGRDIPAVYLEHSTPQGRVNEMRHPAADRRDLTLVHVTHFNALFWDSGSTPTTVIEHGIPDPGYRYAGDLARAGAVINEAPRRARVTGTDLLGEFERAGPIDVFGIDGDRNLSQQELHAELARRRVYVHPYRWTSLGLSLLEAMHLGLPVVALETTEARRAVPANAGVVATDPGILREALAWLLRDSEAARALGRGAREHAVRRYGLERFLGDWDRLLRRVAGAAP